MEFSYPEEYSKSSSEETDRSISEQNNDHDTGTGRSYECVFCKRGFTTAQALGGHMNIHRKDKANKTKPSFVIPSSSSSIKVDDNNNYADLGFYSAIPRGNNHYSTGSHEVDASDHYHHQANFPAPASGVRPSHGQDWRERNLSLYTNPSLCVREVKDKAQDNSDEDGLDLELRLGHHHP